MNKEENKNNLKIIMNISTIIGTIFVCIFFYYAIKADLFSSEENLKTFLNSCGVFAPIFFVFLQIVQVIIPLIPGGISTGVGVIIFGPLWGFIYNYVGIVIGSIIVFFIARKYGMPLIKKMFKKELIDKYIGWLNKGKKFEKLFAAAIFLPVAPDDFLCYLAGVTDISTKKYIAIIVLLKPFTIALYSLFLVEISKIIAILF